MRVTKAVINSLLLTFFGLSICGCTVNNSNIEKNPSADNNSGIEEEFVFSKTPTNDENFLSETNITETVPVNQLEIVHEFSYSGLPANWYVVIQEFDLSYEIYLLELPCWNNNQSCEEQKQLITRDDPPTSQSKYPKISPDGKYIVFTSNRYANSNDLFVYNRLDQMTGRITNTSEKSELYPAWSPDGQRIAFVSDSYGELMIIGYSGCCSMKLPNSAGYNHFPEWSPGGSMIAYRSGPVRETRLYVYDLEEAQAIELTPEITVGSFSWAPDRNMIAFTRVGDDIEDRDVCLYFLDEMVFECVVDTALREDTPFWSLDGKNLFFRRRNPENQIFGLSMVDLETGEIEIIMETNQNYSSCFSITSRHLLCNKHFEKDKQTFYQVVIVDIESHTDFVLVEKDVPLFALDYWIP